MFEQYDNPTLLHVLDMEGKERLIMKLNESVLIAVWCDLCIKSL